MLRTTLRQSKVLIECISLRLTAQEFSQSLHLILATALLKNLVAVPTASSLVHGITLEDSVEHVGGVNLGAAEQNHEYSNNIETNQTKSSYELTSGIRSIQRRNLRSNVRRSPRRGPTRCQHPELPVRPTG